MQSVTWAIEEQPERYSSVLGADWCLLARHKLLACKDVLEVKASTTAVEASPRRQRSSSSASWVVCKSSICSALISTSSTGDKMDPAFELAMVKKLVCAFNYGRLAV